MHPVIMGSYRRLPYNGTLWTAVACGVDGHCRKVEEGALSLSLGIFCEAT